MKTVDLEDPIEETVYLQILQQVTEINWHDIYLTKEQCFEVRDAINAVLEALEDES